MRIYTYWWTQPGSTGSSPGVRPVVPASATFLVHFVKYIIINGSMHFVCVCVCVRNSLIPSDTPNALPNTRCRPMPNKHSPQLQLTILLRLRTHISLFHMILGWFKQTKNKRNSTISFNYATWSPLIPTIGRRIYSPKKYVRNKMHFLFRAKLLRLLMRRLCDRVASRR